MLALLLLTLLSPAHAAELRGPELHGYFRVMARPDLVGGDGRLGTSPFYGRLLNEGPWGLLDVKQPLVGEEGADAPWGDLRFRVEGGSVAGGDPTNGNLLGFRLSMLHLHAGNLGPAGVEWRIGTLETTFGDLWLYDARPSQMLVDVLGASAAWKVGKTEFLVGAGDAGYSLRGARYHTVLSGGGSVKHGLGEHVVVGLGGQAWYEPRDEDPDALRDTPGVDVGAWYGDRAAWARGHADVALGEPVPGLAWKVVAHVGVADVGVIKAARLQAIALRKLPEPPAVEDVDGKEVRVGAASRTDARHEYVLGSEVELELGPVEVAWGAILDHRVDPDDPKGRGGGNRTGVSTVVRAQAPIVPVVSLLVETSLARERARNADVKDTWQGKGGVVIVPGGPGMGSRPALRLLYGAQWSSLPDAWPGSPTGSRWHHLVSAEAEAWF
ncbi:MAG: hypothetical protein ACK4YP_01790 [Myxococcota bacterium]